VNNPKKFPTARKVTTLREENGFLFGTFYLLDTKFQKQKVVFAANKSLVYFQHSSKIFDEILLRLPKTIHFAEILDDVLETTYPLIEQIEDEQSKMEKKILHETENEILHQILNQKKQVRRLRKLVWAVRDISHDLNTNKKMRMVFSDTLLLIDTIEELRESTSGLIELHMSAMNNRMNEVMKVLAVISTFFLPLTFVTGIYGMNFDFMPELGWVYGYPTFWIMVGIIFIGMFVYFRRKNWI
jgi:magnesium transporter